MAIVYFDGFNSYAANSVFGINWTVGGGFPSYVFTTGRYGGNALSANGYISSSITYNATFRYTFQQATATASVGAAIKHTPLAATSNTTPILVLAYNGNSALSAYIYYNSFGNFYYPVIVNGAGTTLITGKPIANYDPAAWHYYEMEAQAGTTTGLVRFYVDSVPVATVTNVNTTYSSNLFYNSAVVQSGAWGSGQLTTLIDDFYVNNTTTRTGEINIVTLRPNSDASVAWTATGGGTHFNQVNGSTYSVNPSTQIGTSTNGADLFNVSDLPTSGTSVLGPIKAIKANTLAYKSAFGKANIFQTMKIGSNTINNTTTIPFESPANSTFLPTNIYETNPFTGTAWTTANINSLQTGVTMQNIQGVFFSITNGYVLNTASGTSLVSGDTAPTQSGDALSFNGTQIIRYTDGTPWRVTPPYSVQFEFLLTRNDVDQWLFNIGEGFGAGWPELSVVSFANNNGVISYTNSNNTAGGQQAGTLIGTGKLVTNRWYTVGVMMYTNSGTRFRGYLDGAQVFDIPITAPYDSTNGMSIGGDAIKNSTRMLYGSIRNFSVAKTLFWPI